MNNLLPNPNVFLVNDKPATTSLAIAEHFGKAHDRVLKDIRQVAGECPVEFNAVNFDAVEYTDAKGEKRPMYTVYFDGFVLLVMGYTGKKALQIKLAYIAAFNAMRERLAAQPFGSPEKLPDTPITPDQQCTLQAMVKALVGRGGYYANIWSRFNNHFRLGSYKQLPQSRLSEAIDYLMRLPVEPKKLPPSPTVAKNATVGIAGGELLSTHTPTALPEISPDDISPQTWAQMHKDWFCELMDIEQKLERLVTMVGFWGRPGARLLNMSPEKDILFTNASNTFRLALHGIAIAKSGIANAAQVCANVDFLCPDRR